MEVKIPVLLIIMMVISRHLISARLIPVEVPCTHQGQIESQAGSSVWKLDPQAGCQLWDALVVIPKRRSSVSCKYPLTLRDILFLSAIKQGTCFVFMPNGTFCNSNRFLEMCDTAVIVNQDKVLPMSIMLVQEDSCRENLFMNLTLINCTNSESVGTTGTMNTETPISVIVLGILLAIVSIALVGIIVRLYCAKDESLPLGGAKRNSSEEIGKVVVYDEIQENSATQPPSEVVDNQLYRM